MKPSIERKLGEVRDRHEELAALMSDPEVVADAPRFASLSREFAELEPIVGAFRQWHEAVTACRDSEALLDDPDADMRALAAEEAASSQEQAAALEAELETLLLPRDPADRGAAFVEIRAGTGGDEAALFAGVLFRMYSRYAEQQGWSVEVLSARPGEVGGYREIIARIGGADVYGQLKFESGAHRVQRVPETESQGRIHTSACTVAVLPEPEAVTAIEIPRDALRIDTFRASGAGGQHVNKTDSAVRITHLPTGMVVECQDERSQHKNRARAMSLLQARLEDSARQAQTTARAETRRNLVGSGDRSQRIRTYNFPQGRITDHRIDLTLYALGEILEGALEQLVDPLRREHQADLLAGMAASQGE